MTLNDFHSAFLNLDSRPDRLNHMNAEFLRIGLEAERVRGKLPNEFDLNDPKIQRMKNRTPGAIGCHYGQVTIMEKALELGKSAFVMEDDLDFCTDFKERLEYIFAWMENNSWDVFWLGATFHLEPPYWHCKGGSRNHSNNISAELGYDAKRTPDPRIMRTYGAFSTYAYLVNGSRLEKILKLLDANVHTSEGIDGLFIKLQPQLRCFCFVPGCVKQYDNQSNIGSGMTIFSNFLSLNGTRENSAYVFQDKMELFDPLTFNWHEAN